MGAQKKSLNRPPAEREGFEPSVQLFAIHSLSRRAPSTNSAISPPSKINRKQRRRRDSNPRHSRAAVFKTAALNHSATPPLAPPTLPQPIKEPPSSSARRRQRAQDTQTSGKTQPKMGLIADMTLLGLGAWSAAGATPGARAGRPADFLDSGPGVIPWRVAL